MAPLVRMSGLGSTIVKSLGSGSASCSPERVLVLGREAVHESREPATHLEPAGTGIEQGSGEPIGVGVGDGERLTLDASGRSVGERGQGDVLIDEQHRQI